MNVIATHQKVSLVGKNAVAICYFRSGTNFRQIATSPCTHAARFPRNDG